jgi:hypothetical protein
LLPFFSFLAGAAAYEELGLFKDIGYAVILSALAVIPTLGSYV